MYLKRAHRTHIDMTCDMWHPEYVLLESEARFTDTKNNWAKNSLFGRKWIIHRWLVGTVLCCTMELVVFRVDNVTTHIYVWLAWYLLWNCPHMADRCHTILPLMWVGLTWRETADWDPHGGRKQPTSDHSQGCVITLHVEYILYTL